MDACVYTSLAAQTAFFFLHNKKKAVWAARLRAIPIYWHIYT